MVGPAVAVIVGVVMIDARVATDADSRIIARKRKTRAIFGVRRGLRTTPPVFVVVKWGVFHLPTGVVFVEGATCPWYVDEDTKEMGV